MLFAKKTKNKSEIMSLSEANLYLKGNHPPMNLLVYCSGFQTFFHWDPLVRMALMSAPTGRDVMARGLLGSWHEKA